MATDPKMVRFLELFSRTLDPGASAQIAGVPLEDAEKAVARSRSLQRRLAKLFEVRTTLYDHVPLAVVRLELLALLANPGIQPGHRVSAAKILIDLIAEGVDDKRATIGKLLKAIDKGAAGPAP